MKTRIVISACVLSLLLGGCVYANVLINEIAWSGTAASSSDEWIELYNPTDEDVDLTGWILLVGDAEIHLGDVAGSTREVRRTMIPARGYFLLERTDDTTVADIEADVLYRGALSNDGENLELLDADGGTVDQALFAEAGWPAGLPADEVLPYATMERLSEPVDGAHWGTCVPGAACNGTGANGESICGTPRQENSVVVLAAGCPTVELTEPSAGTVQDTVIVRWTAADPDGDDEALAVRLTLVAADGSSVLPLIENLTNAGSYAWDTTEHPDGEYSLRITVSDVDDFAGFDRMEGIVIDNGLQS